MSANEGDKPKADADAAQKAGMTPPPAARGSRRATTQVVAPASTDAFATPSDAPKSDEPAVFLGPEPAIFGGLNPIGGPAGMANPGLPPDPTAVPVQESVPDDDELPPRGAFVQGLGTLATAFRRSSVLLVLAMAVFCIGGYFLVEAVLPERAFAFCTVRLQKPPGPPLSPQESEVYRKRVLDVLGWRELADLARKKLNDRNTAKHNKETKARGKSDEVTLGFLGGGYLFREAGAVTWIDSQTFLIRRDTEYPEDDKIRLTMAVEAFRDKMKDETADPDNHSLAEARHDLAEWTIFLDERREALKEELATVKERTTATSQNTRAKELQSSIDRATEEQRKLRRTIDVWPRVELDQAWHVDTHDNRIWRTRLRVGIWFACIAFFGVAIVLNEMRKNREDQERRRRRRQRMEAQQQ